MRPASRPFLRAFGLLPIPCLALFLLYPPSALSQGAPAPGAHDLIQERQQKLLEGQQRRLEELKRLPGPQTPPPARPGESGGCVNIQSIQLEGAERLPEAERRALTAPYEGQCLEEGRLNALLAGITQAYLSRGLITTRAYLPPQDASGGILKVTVIEGRLEAIESSGIPSQREIAMSFPGKIGALLNVRELEQMLDQLSRLPSRAATLDLLPGTEPGASKIQIKNAPQKPWRAGLRYDNSGIKSTGERQLGASFSWDSPLGLADQLNLAAGRDAVTEHWRRANNQSASYSLPWGWWTFSASASRNSYQNLAETPGLTWKNSGDSHQYRAHAERLLFRDASSKSSAAVGLNHMRANNYLEDLWLEVSSYKLSELELSLSHGRRIHNSFVNLELGWQRGIGALNAQSRGHPRAGEPDAHYDKYTLTVSALAPFKIGAEDFSAESVAFGQKSDAALYSAQRLGLGGLSSVRGFKDQTQYGNSGAYWRNQLRWRTSTGRIPQVTDTSVALLYDIGAIHGNKHQGEEAAHLSGAGIELTAQGKYLSASLTYAHTLTRPKSWKREHPVYFNVNLTY